MGNVIALVGPTAVGKTACAIELVKLIGGEIISADSMAVYRDMDIGTAKPTLQEQSEAKFHLIDVANPEDGYSVGEFQKAAHEAISDVISRNPPAIVVGGSGLYVRAAIDGLDDSLPQENEILRRELRSQAEEFGKEYVHQRLARIDPKSAELIHPANLKRIIRAIEIFEATGSPASEHFVRHAESRQSIFEADFFGLSVNRQTLYERIEKRVDIMIESGLVEEVDSLIGRGVDRSAISMQGLGYKEIARYLMGECTKEDAISQIKANTRRFAKRQYTWFRADTRIRWIDTDTQTVREAASLMKETIT